eukprot:Hpha_TRINITY_DN25358_c0_g1::TRINITY_DN25358_c0_g1_i1::g.2791::m.2791
MDGVAQPVVRPAGQYVNKAKRTRLAKAKVKEAEARAVGVAQDAPKDRCLEAAKQKLGAERVAQLQADYAAAKGNKAREDPIIVTVSREGKLVDHELRKVFKLGFQRLQALRK